MVVDSNGHDEVALARYNEADGSLDTTFGTGGLVTTDLGTGWNGTGAVAVESNGSILVAGSYDGHFALLALLKHRRAGHQFWRRDGRDRHHEFRRHERNATAMTIDRQRLYPRGRHEDANPQHGQGFRPGPLPRQRQSGHDLRQRRNRHDLISQ